MSNSIISEEHITSCNNVFCCATSAILFHYSDLFSSIMCLWYYMCNLPTEESARLQEHQVFRGGRWRWGTAICHLKGM